jgi:hypothetical protein
MPALTSWHFLYKINYLAGVVAAGASCVGDADSSFCIINDFRVGIIMFQ